MPYRLSEGGCGRNGFLQSLVITTPFQNSACRFGSWCCTAWRLLHNTVEWAKVELREDYISLRGGGNVRRPCRNTSSSFAGLWPRPACRGSSRGPAYHPVPGYEQDSRRSGESAKMAKDRHPIGCLLHTGSSAAPRRSNQAQVG